MKFVSTSRRRSKARKWWRCPHKQADSRFPACRRWDRNADRHIHGDAKGHLWLRRALFAVCIPEQFAATRQQISRSEEHTSELQSLIRISYAVFSLKKKKEN